MYDWNTKILTQFLSSLYYDAHRVTFYWLLREKSMALTTWLFWDSLDLDQKIRNVTQLMLSRCFEVIKCHSCSSILCWQMREMQALFSHATMAWIGFFRNTIDAKKGDGTALHHYAVNLLARTMPGGRPFCIMDYMWNELRRVMVDPDKHLPYAPYIMYMIERVTKFAFPKSQAWAPSPPSSLRWCTTTSS